MYFSKKAAEAVQEEQTDIWQCSTEGCPCWMRANFAFEETPDCPICQSSMIKDTRMLPTLSNISGKR